jgi:hypothetical protein
MPPTMVRPCNCSAGRTTITPRADRWAARPDAAATNGLRPRLDAMPAQGQRRGVPAGGSPPLFTPPCRRRELHHAACFSSCRSSSSQS